MKILRQEKMTWEWSQKRKQESVGGEGGWGGEMKSEKWSEVRTSEIYNPEKEGFFVDGLGGREKEESKLTPQYHQLNPH